MVNFSKDNLIEVDKSTVSPYSLAIKVNDMVLLCASGSESESGGGSSEGGSEVMYGYINEDGLFQQVELDSSYAHDTGYPIQCNLKLFQTGKDEPKYAQAELISGKYGFAKVTRYTAATDTQAMVLQGAMATGYSNGRWSFFTENTTFEGFEKEPKLGYVYVVIDNKLIGNPIASTLTIPTDGLIFYAPLENSASTAETGQPLTAEGDILYGNIDGERYATFDGEQYITASDAGFPTGTAARTIAFKFLKDESYDSDITIFSYGEASNNKRFSIGFSGDSLEVWGRSNTTTYDYEFEPGRWHHCAVTFEAGTECLYVNGAFVETQEHSGLNTALAEVCIGACSGDHIDGFVGCIADVCVYNRVLTADEISELANNE